VLHELIVLAADDVFDIARRLLNSTRDVLELLAIVAAIALVIATYFKTRAMVPTLVAIVLSAAVLWAVNRPDFLQSTTTETIEQGAADPIAQPAQLPA
jgi:hypothetical protein